MSTPVAASLSVLSLLLTWTSQVASAPTTVSVPLAQLTFSGGWATGSDPDCGAYYFTQTPGATVSYTFTGTAYTATILGLPLSGECRETLDGGQTFDREDFQSDDKICTNNGFEADGLDFGQYTVQIQHMSNLGAYTYISSFSYVTDPTLAPVSASASLTSATVDPLASMSSTLSVASTASVVSFVSTESVASTLSIASVASELSTTTALSQTSAGSTIANAGSSTAASPSTTSQSSSGGSSSTVAQGNTDSTTGGLSSGKIAAIVLAVIIGGAGLIWLLWRCCRDPDDDEYDDQPFWASLFKRQRSDSSEDGDGSYSRTPEMQEARSHPV